MIWNAWFNEVPPSIIEELYDNKGTAKLVGYLKDKKRIDVQPENLLEILKIKDNDSRFRVLDNMTNYSAPSFRVIDEKTSFFFIPEDKRFVAGIRDFAKDIFIRTPYVQATIDYDLERKHPEIDLHVFGYPIKGEENLIPYNHEEVLKDAIMILEFTR